MHFNNEDSPSYFLKKYAVKLNILVLNTLKSISIISFYLSHNQGNTPVEKKYEQVDIENIYVLRIHFV